MRWFLAVSVLMAGTVLAQGGMGSGKVVGRRSGGDVVVGTDRGWVVVNGKRVARLSGRGAVTIVVVNGKVYVNGREVKVPPSSPPPAAQHHHSILLERLKALLRRYYGQLPEGLRRSLQKIFSEAKKRLQRLPSTPGELKERTERWHREMRRRFEHLERVLSEDARRRMQHWLRRAPQELLERVRKWKRFLPEEVREALDEWIRRFPREKVEKWLRPVEHRLKHFVERMRPELRPVIEEMRRLEAQIERIKRQFEGLLRRYEERGDEDAPHLFPPHRRRFAPPQHPLPPSFHKLRALRELLKSFKPEDIERLMRMAEELSRNLTPEDIERIAELLKRLLPEREPHFRGGGGEEEAGF